MKKIKYILIAAALLAASCERKFDRDSNPMVIFHDATITGNINVDEQIEGVVMTLNYKYGQNNHVTVTVPTQMGIGAELFSCTLNEDSGTIEIPLQGITTNAGVLTLTAFVNYDRYTIMSTATASMRPVPLPDTDMESDATLSGQLYQDLPASTCQVSVNYSEGWGRTASVWFESNDPGIGNAPVEYILALDDQATTLTVPIPGTPQNLGNITLLMYVQIEGEDAPRIFDMGTVEVLSATPYVPEQVSQTIKITDRNTLMGNGGVYETATFTYNTVFVDMNGDGYVSGNYEIWLDMNVGATSTETSLETSYGFLYQPGREAPGWVDNSQNGSTYMGEPFALNNASWFNGTALPVTFNRLNASGAVSGTITVEAGKIGPSNPCPEGFRPPTGSEWMMLYNFLGASAGNYTIMRDGLLRIPFVGGYTANTGAAWTNKGVLGQYWCAPFDNNQVPGIFFQNATPVANRVKGMALPVRCVKAKDSELATY